MNCKKCSSRLVTCPGCNGRPQRAALGGMTRLTCKKCDNTGRVCATHGANWN